MNFGTRSSFYLLLLLVSILIIYDLSAQSQKNNSILLNNLENTKKLRIAGQCLEGFSRDQIISVWAGLPTDVKCDGIIDEISESSLSLIDVVLFWINEQKYPEYLSEKIHEPLLLVYSWRNQEWKTTDPPNALANQYNSAHFVAQLAKWAWLQDRADLALQFSEFALHQSPTEEVAWVLISGIIPTATEGDLGRFVDIRRAIANYLPEYTFNYIQTFETLSRLEDWHGALEFCERLQQHSALTMNATAATCDARIAFYRRDYESARDLLEPRLAQYASDVTFLIWYGNTLLRTGDNRIAEEIYQRAIQISEDNSSLLTLYWRLGDAQAAQYKTNQAVASYTIALGYATSEDHITRLRVLLAELEGM